jgi:hypothetical protein
MRNLSELIPHTRSIIAFPGPVLYSSAGCDIVRTGTPKKGKVQIEQEKNQEKEQKIEKQKNRKIKKTNKNRKKPTCPLPRSTCLRLDVVFARAFDPIRVAAQEGQKVQRRILRGLFWRQKDAQLGGWVLREIGLFFHPLTSRTVRHGSCNPRLRNQHNRTNRAIAGHRMVRMNPIRYAFRLHPISFLIGSRAALQGGQAKSRHQAPPTRHVPSAAATAAATPASVPSQQPAAVAAPHTPVMASRARPQGPKRSTWVGGPGQALYKTTALGNEFRVDVEGPPPRIDLVFSLNADNLPIYRRQPGADKPSAGATDAEHGEETAAATLALTSKEESELARKLKALSVNKPLEEDKELLLLFDTLPANLKDPIVNYLKTERGRQLVEVVIDTGRPPVLWFQDDTSVPAQREVEQEDLQSCLDALLAGTCNVGAHPTVSLKQHRLRLYAQVVRSSRATTESASQRLCTESAPSETEGREWSGTCHVAHLRTRAQSNQATVRQLTSSFWPVRLTYRIGRHIPGVCMMIKDFIVNLSAKPASAVQILFERV